MDAWEERFYGNENAVITLLKGGGRVRVEVYCQTEPDAMELKAYWGGSVRHLPNKDWVAASAVVKPPLKIKDRIVVTMENDGEGLDALRAQYPERLVISVPPEMAFGTGDHPTTATCLRLLLEEADKLAGKSWDFLDLGTGSGLLAIAAKHLGAKRNVGIDYDQAAVDVAIKNALRNDAEDLELSFADVFEWEPEGQFEVVAANLFSDVLIAAMPRMVPWIKPGGTLIVSGILNEQWEAVCAAGNKEGISFEEPRQKGKWTTCRGRRDN
ncbi:MAG: 50S ribosomal protein L11 methyltransferase [Verrucomicrobiota bacterium JB023]|nr:50S ribosomal protein L11 methyltransferase [Verrucomicrobiota bacterium JB023]